MTIKTACHLLAAYLRSPEGMTTEERHALADVFEWGAKNEPEKIGSQAEKTDA